MTDTSDVKNGILLQGRDSELYFVPQDRLEEFRVGEGEAMKVRKQLEELDADEVSGFNFSSSNLELAPNVHQLPAFEGPLGRLPDIDEVSDNSPTLIY